MSKTDTANHQGGVRPLVVENASSSRECSTRMYEEEEIDLIELFSGVMRRWKLCVGIVSVAVAIAAGYAFTKTPSYLATAQIQAQFGRLKISPVEGIQEGRSVNDNKTFINTQMTILQGPTLMTEILKDNRLANDENLSKSLDPVESVSKLFQIKNLPNTNIIEVGFEYTDPKVSADITNKLCSLFIDSARNRAKEVSQQASNKLLQELELIDSLRKQAVKERDDFIEKYNITNFDLAYSIAMSLMETYSKDLSNAQNNTLFALNVQKSAFNYWKSQGLDFYNKPKNLDSGRFDSLLGERDKAVSELERLALEFNDNNQRMSMARLKLKGLEKELHLEIENIEKRLDLEKALVEARIKQVSEKLAEIREEVKRLRELSVQYKTLETKVDDISRNYSVMLTRANDLRAATNVDDGSEGVFNIIAKATVPKKKFAPKRLKIIGIAAVASGVFAVLLAMMLEMFGDRPRELFSRRKEDE